MQSALAFSSHRPGLTEKVGIKVRVFAFTSIEIHIFTKVNILLIGNITTNNAANHYTCRFTRDLDVTKTTKTKAGANYTKTFDLGEGKKWNVFIAKGKMDKGVIQYHQSSKADGNTATFRRGFKF